MELCPTDLGQILDEKIVNNPAASDFELVDPGNPVNLVNTDQTVNPDQLVGSRLSDHRLWAVDILRQVASALACEHSKGEF